MANNYYLSLNDLISYFFIFTVLPISFLVYYYRDLIFGLPISGTMHHFKLGDSRIIKFIDNSIGEINILSGEACPAVFTEKTEESLRNAKERGLRIRVILGPFIISRHDTKDQSVIPKLANEGILDLYILKKREETHFTVDKKGRLNIEKPHEPNEIYRTAMDFVRNQFEARRYRKKFERLIKNHKAEKYIPYETELLFITVDELEELKKRIKKQKRNIISKHSREEIKNMMFDIRNAG